MDLLSFLFTTSSFCVIFLVKVYTVFFGKKWVALKGVGCWVALKRTGFSVVWKNGPETSQELLEMTTVCLNTSFKSCSSMVNGVVQHALLELMPCLNQPLSQLNHVADR